jgi:hypothetical protein
MAQRRAFRPRKTAWHARAKKVNWIQIVERPIISATRGISLTSPPCFTSEPSINAPTEALNQRSRWWRMGDSNTVLSPESIAYEGKDLCC